MLENGIAEPSSSSWASPCLLVEKADKSPRFCTDYSKMNAVTKADKYPLPRIEDCIDQVAAACFVSKFDLLRDTGRFHLLTEQKRSLPLSHPLAYSRIQ